MTRFRIDLAPLDTGWEAVIYDLHDHGPDVPYATVTTGSIEATMDRAAHYVFVASVDDPRAFFC